MSLADLASLSTIISGLAVAASLIYLGLQVHQNSKHTRALIHQGRSSRFLTAMLGLADTELSAAWIAATGGTPTPEAIRQRQFILQCGAAFNGYEETFSHFEDALLSEAQFASYRVGVEGFLRDRVVREFWQRWKVGRAEKNQKFASFVDGLVAQAESASSAVN
jgi:hypothetical protein